MAYYEVVVEDTVGKVYYVEARSREEAGQKALRGDLTVELVDEFETVQEVTSIEEADE